MSFITLTDVSKNYALGNTTVRALKNVDLTIERGEFTAVWGPSGSGKSTLLNILATIDTPSRGSYCFDGRAIDQLSDKSLTDMRQRRIGIIFQHFNLIPVLTALENVMMPMQLNAAQRNTLSHRALKERALALMNEVGVSDLALSRPDHLSGGQRQRVAIARALITEPEFVVADEPTANLDSHTSEKIIQLMQTLNKQHGTTFIFSTHHNLLIASAERTIQLLDGSIANLDYSTPLHQLQTSREVSSC